MNDKPKFYEGATIGDAHGDLEVKGWKGIEVDRAGSDNEQALIVGYGKTDKDRVIEFAWEEGSKTFQLSLNKGAVNLVGTLASSFPMEKVPTPAEAETMLALKQMKDK